MTSRSIKQRTLVLLALLAVGLLVYSNTFRVPFHFDDPHVVSDVSFEEMLQKCKSGGARAVSHLTFLFNYWLGGTSVLGYHIFNILIHIGTAYFVYLFLYQILSLANRLERFEQLEWIETSDPVFWPALVGGMLFLVHPLATQAVTYIAQRYTSLAGFFYIGSLTFYVSARTDLKRNERFSKGTHLLRYVCSFVMAALAMFTKEMAITLPAVILLTEYSLMQSDFRTQVKRILYLLPLLCTALIIPASNIMGIKTISLETMAALQDYTWAPQISRTEYLFTQFKVIAGIYLKLMFWPIGQNIDHDYVVSETLLDHPTMASFLALCVLLGIGLWLFRRARLVSFGILWFFVTISPTSSIVPNNEFVAEHRTYISLMGLAFAVAGLSAWQRRWKSYLAVLLPSLFIFSSLTYARNRVWQTDLILWTDSVAKSPKRARAQYNLGVALGGRGKLNEAISHYSQALCIKPDYIDARNNLGSALIASGKTEEAAGHFSEILRIRPDLATAHNNIGFALAEQGRPVDAISHYCQALQIRPDYAEAHNNLGITLARQGRLAMAVEHYSRALEINPLYATAHQNIAVALARLGRRQEAIAHYSQALLAKPDCTEAHYDLAGILAEQGSLNEAVDHYSRALQIKPDYAEARNNLGNTLVRQGRLDDAIHHYSNALQVKPDSAQTHYNLGAALAKQGKLDEAITHYSKTLRIEPDQAEAHNNLGVARMLRGNLKQAAFHYVEALKIRPEFADAHNNLGIVLAAHGKIQEAIVHYNEALRIRPEYPEARHNLEIALQKMAETKQSKDSR